MSEVAKRSRILVVDDELLIRAALAHALEEAGYEVAQAPDAKETLRAVGRELPDLILLDFRLPDRTGVELLADLRALAPMAPVILMTAHASIGGAVLAMKEGAYDYIAKPFETAEVLATIGRALEARRLREQVASQNERALLEFGVHEFVAESPAMRQVVRLVRRVAESEASTILLTGESGVGKGLVARALHQGSSFAEKPFMHITCTALSETLLESELFGHEKGAFTDAKMQKKGLFELADEGTVFLDEIGDLSAGLQGKLLRFLEDRAFRRVGGVRDIRVSVRVISATNKDLLKEVQAGRFREDLYFRIRVIPIEIPPLRERVEDVLPLATRFIRHFNGELRKAIEEIEPETAELMKLYAWPGNVRELRNAIERAVLLSDGPVLGADDLPPEIRARASLPGSGPGFVLPRNGLDLELLEQDLVRQALERTRGNRTRAARLLGMNRDQIRYRLEKYRIDQPELEIE